MPDIDLEVFFQSDLSTRAFKDVEFGETIEWDVPLLEGYRSRFLPILMGAPDRIGVWTPINSGMVRHLKRSQFDVLWVHGYLRPYNIMVVFFAHLAGLNVFIRDDVHGVGKRRQPFVSFFKHMLIRAYARCGMIFLAVGKLNHDYYYHLGAPEHQIVTLPYAVDNDFFQRKAADARGTRDALKASLGLDSRASIILFAGKFLPRKRAGDLLEAYRRLLAILAEASPGAPSPHLIFAGSGETLAETRAAAEGLAQVRFLGFQSQAELARLFELCDVFVMPSALEPWGLVVNEVMNAAKAVIVTDEAGCGPDLVKPGYNGFIYPVGDCDRLARHLLTLMLDPALRSRMGQRSLEIIDRWSFDQDCDGLRAALKTTMRRAAR